MAFIRCGSGVVKSSQIINLQVEQVLKSFHITWNNPDDLNLMGVRIIYKADSLPENENDGIVAYESDNAIPVEDITVDQTVDANTTVYFRAFAWTYLNATRIYTDTLTGATASLTTVLIKDMISFTESQDLLVPAGVTVVDVFAVGGGGSGGFGSGEYSGGGGGGGYTKTVKGLSVVPKSVIPITVGAGGMRNSNTTSDKTDGGTSSFGDYVIALGGITAGRLSGANGGSGGGGTNTDYGDGLRGGSDGADGYDGYYDGGKGQGTTTRAFEETDGELFAGGGGGGGGYGGAGGAGGGGTGAGNSKASDGTPNTGGGGGGTLSTDYRNCGKGGSGIVIVRWGYE